MSSYNGDFSHIPSSPGRAGVHSSGAQRLSFGLHAGFGDYHDRARCGAQAVTGDRAERGPGLADRGAGQARRAGAAQDEHGRARRTLEKHLDRQAIDNLELDSRPAVRADRFPYQCLQGRSL